MSSTLESLHLVGETIRDVWAEFMDYFDAAKIAGKLYSEKVLDYSVMEIIKKAKSKKDANGAFLEHLNSNATVESLKTLCELLRATSGNCPRHACLAKLLDEKLTRKVPQSSMCVAAPDLSTGISHKDTYLAKDPPHRRLEAMFSRLLARLARIFNKHIEALKPILRARQKREEWPCNLLEVEDIDDAKNILTIFNKIRIEDCWLNTELLIRLIEALPDEESCDEAQQHLEQYHEFLNGFCKSVLLKEIPSDDAYLKHFRSRPLAIIVNVTFDVHLAKFYFSNLLKQQEFLSRMFKIPIEAFHYLEAKTTESTLVTWALDISIKETVYLLQRAADAFWSLKEYSIIKVEIADVGVLYLRGKDLPKLIKKALQGNQDFFSCTEHVSHQFLALVDYHHLKRRDTEEYRHSMLLQLPLPKQLLQDSVSLNVVEPGVEQEQTGPTLTAPSGPTLTAPTGPTLTAPSGPTLTAPTDPTLTTSTDPALTTPTGPALTTPTDPALTTPTGPALTTPTGPTLTTPTGPTLTTPTGPALTTPTGPALTTPTGPALTTPTGPTLTIPTGPIQTKKNVPTKTTPTGLSPLMLAASGGNNEIVASLQAVANTIGHQLDSDGRTALHHACVSGHLEVGRTLMNKEPSLVNQGDEVEHTPLMLAASQGYHEVVNFFTTIYICMLVTMVLHKKPKNRQTALRLACLAGHLEVVGTLLDAGAIIDECDESGLTPIMLAASEGHDKIVNRLLCADANLGKQCNADGKTALHYAAEQGAMLSVNELLLSGASIDLKDVYGHTPLTIATIKRQYDVAIQLIQTGADITHLTRHEGRDLAEEVLSFAIQANLTQNTNYQNFCALFQQDSGVNLQNWNTYKHSVATLILGQLRTGGFKHPTLLATDPPMTELMWSTHKGYDSLVKYLILQGVDVNAQNVQGNTALHFAAQDNHIQCGLLLAKAGANVRTNNSLSEAPFDVSTTEFKEAVLYASFQTKKIVCVLGNALTGKSTLIASLQNENANVFTKARHWLFGVGNISQRPAGIEPVSLSSKRYGNVLFYDFAGQHEYHGPHELFLESIISRELSSVAVVAVVNITEKQSGMFQQLNRWLQPFYKLPSTTNPIPVILVGSHLDKAKRQDEAKHNLYMCCEQLKSQGDSVLQFDSICCLDCRQPYAPDIKKLCKYLQDVPLPQCEDSHTGYSLPWVISQIHSSFTEEEVLPLSEFAAWICQNEANLPTNLPPAEDVCRDLASTGHFLYLPSKKALSEGWLVLDLPSILKEVYGILFSSGKSKVNKFGLLSCAHLPALFPRFEPSLVRSILVSLGFGVEVDPSVLSEATHLIESSDREHKYLFIPALVTASQPNVFANTSGSAHMFCWQFEVDEKLFLSPRILQAVILQLASHHVFPHKQGSKVEPLAYSVWLNGGIFWKSRRDADVAVQISDNTAIHVIGCSEVSAEALCRYMSTVVQDIARTIKSIDASMHGSAYIVCPQPANLQFLLENPRPPAHQKFPIDVMLDSIRDGSVTTTSLDSPSSTWQRKMSLSELFGGFKPSMEAVKGFLVLQDSTAQPTDPSSGLTTTTGPTQTPHNDPLMSMPNMEILDNLVVQKIASNWHRVCIHLGIPPEVQKAIQANHPSDVEQCCHNMFIRWLSPKLGSGAKPRTWESILIALQKADYPHVAEDVRREITGHTAIISSSSVVTPNEDILTAPSDSLLTTFTGLTLTTPTGSYLTTPTSLLLSLPNIETLDLFGVYEVAARWQKVGVHLGMTSEALQIIQANHPSNVVQCCHDMFDRWLFSRKGTGEKPRTWEIVLSALENANCSNVAADLRRELDPAS